MNEQRVGEVMAEARLPRPPGVLRRWVAAHPRAVDGTIVICYLLGVALCVLLDFVSQNSVFDEDGNLLTGEEQAGFVPPYLMWPWALLAVARVAIVSVALWWRRRAPLAGLVAVLVMTLGFHGMQELATNVALLFLLYAVPVYRGAAAGWIGYGIAVVGTTLRELVSPTFQISTGPAGTLFTEDALTSTGSDTFAYAVVVAVWYLAIVLLGINLGNRRRYLAAIIDRAQQLANERDQLAKLAVAEERERISREMHDIVAHSLSVMIALSEGAARAVASAPDASVDAMRKSAETGRKALAETRRLLGALSEGDPALAPQPGLSDVPELVQGFRAAGLRVGLRIEGHPSGDRSHELAVYRAVQEALTNALRYAGHGARVEVVIVSDPTQTSLAVRDHGAIAGSTPARTGLGAGKGLAGMSERARMLGGTATAAPATDGAGWQLQVTLPAAIGTETARSPQPRATREETEQA